MLQLYLSIFAQSTRFWTIIECHARTQLFPIDTKIAAGLRFLADLITANDTILNSYAVQIGPYEAFMNLGFILYY